MKWVLLAEFLITAALFTLVYLIRRSAKYPKEASPAILPGLLGIAMIGVMIVTLIGWGVYGIVAS
jgi:hypothetical protein